MKVSETILPGVLIIEPQVFEDSRGFFFECYHSKKFEAFGIRDNFVQDNQSRSAQGVLRGLHYQLKHPQAKLCRVTYGEALDVVVDIRKGSPTFGKSLSIVLSEKNKKQIYIPKGFAHGFCALSGEVDFVYKCSDFYDPKDEYGILWNDPHLKIDWLIPSPLVSEKDKLLQTFMEISPEKLPIYKNE